MSALGDASGRVVPVDAVAGAAARTLYDRLTKPPGSLGRLEDIGAQLSAISGKCPPPIPDPATVAVFAGDHGVLAEGISPWPQEVTAQMVANFGAGGAAVNVLSKQVGAGVVVVDVGVAADLAEFPGLRRSKVRPGTANLAKGPAMSEAEALAALDVGASLAAELAAGGTRCLLTGDMGIGNTTPSAALIAVLCQRPGAEVTGRGTGIDDERMIRKIEIVERAVERANEEGPSTPVQLLASIGGLEIAALAGYIIGGSAAGLPVLLDGVIALAGAVVAAAIVPDSVGYMIAGHRSTEPGATAALGHLGLDPLLDLGMRLGEGTGACLALPVLQSAARVVREMATFDAAGVSERPA
ncbi:MAG: nicotinate-nucleotide--dimethylbenzimidazole phosphoribosyltransferase [Acidimicrobiales bacterium]